MKLSSALMMSAALNVPTIPGTPFAGGYYVGRLAPGDGNKYALIVAPKDPGEWQYNLNYKIENTSVSGAGSPWDGAANTQALIALGATVSAIADFVLVIRNNGGINGYNDWFVPARYQLEMIYRNLKTSTTANRSDGPGITSNSYADPNTPAYTATNPPQTSAAAFKAGGAEAFQNNNYWSSTEYPSANAWCTDMDSGYFTNYNKTFGFACRLVRMIRIS